MTSYSEGTGDGKNLLFAKLFLDWKRDQATEGCDSLEQGGE